MKPAPGVGATAKERSSSPQGTPVKWSLQESRRLTTVLLRQLHFPQEQLVARVADERRSLRHAFYISQRSVVSRVRLVKPLARVIEFTPIGIDPRDAVRVELSFDIS